MGRHLILGLLVLAPIAQTADAAPEYLAVGRFEEHGRGVRGHGRVLRRALRAELSQSGAFELVADDSARRESLKRIKKDLSTLTDDRQWVEVGKAVGATHLILGEVQEDQNTCLAFAQLIHLESQKTKVSLPEYYDCTRSDLVQIAGSLSMQLTGKRASAPRPRRHLIPKKKAVAIKMRDRTAVVDGKRYTFYDGEMVDPEDVPADRPPPPPPVTTAPPPPLERRPDPPTHVSYAPTPAPRPSFDLSRWPGFADQSDEYTLIHLARDLSPKRELVESALLVIPFVLLIVGVVVSRARENGGHAILRAGFGFSVLAVAGELAIVAFYRWVLDRDIMLDADPILLAAPVAGIALWLIGGWIFSVLGAYRVSRQILWTFLFAAYFLVVLLVASQVVSPVWFIGVVTFAFFVITRTLAQFRKKSAEAA